MMEYSQTNIDESQIVAYLNGEVLPEEVSQKIASWLEDEAHQQDAQRIYQAWELSSMAAESKVDSNAAFEQLKTKIDLTEEKTAKVISLNRWWYAAAAVALIVASIWWRQPADDTIVWQSEKAAEELVLTDESKITLNELSSITYSPNALSESSKREVTLKGEAFFEVMHNPARPFFVHTTDIEVKVLGTKFMVKTFDDKPSQVIVTEGKVQVTYLATGQVLILQAEEEVAPESNEKPTITESDENQLYWKTGVLIFPENSLAEVLSTLEMEFGKTIEVESETLLNCRISVTFEKQSLPTIIKVITSTLNLQHEITDEKILIKGDGCQ